MKNFFKKIVSTIHGIFRSFFYRGKDFQPVYFWVTVLMSLIVYMMWLRAHNEIVSISDTLLISMFGGVIALLGLYNWNSIKNPRKMMDEAKGVLDDLKDKL